MGSTNKTTNYELSQFVGLDKPSWLSDYNGDMAKIDTAIKARSVEAGAAQTTADTANGKADALDTRMGTAENNITALQNASTTDHTQIATNTANISQNAQDIVQLDAKIGHTQITIGDHTVTGAIATLVQSQGSGDAKDISYDNTTSGLTATNVQAAIDEVKADIPTIPSTYDADDIVYDNTTSGLTATNVQGAIDELAQSATTETWREVLSTAITTTSAEYTMSEDVTGKDLLVIGYYSGQTNSVRAQAIVYQTLGYEGGIYAENPTGGNRADVLAVSMVANDGTKIKIYSTDNSTDRCKVYVKA